MIRYTYKLCLTCDASGYDRHTKNQCPDCNGKGIKIKKEEDEEEKEINILKPKDSQ